METMTLHQTISFRGSMERRALTEGLKRNYYVLFFMIVSKRKFLKIRGIYKSLINA